MVSGKVLLLYSEWMSQGKRMILAGHHARAPRTVDQRCDVPAETDGCLKTDQITFVSQNAPPTAPTHSILASIPECSTRGGSSALRTYCEYLCLLRLLAPRHSAPNPPKNPHRTCRKSRRFSRSHTTASAKPVWSLTSLPFL